MVTTIAYEINERYTYKQEYRRVLQVGLKTPPIHYMQTCPWF